MTQKQHITIKWSLFAIVIIIAVLVMCYKHRPIKEVEQPKNNFPTYKMY